MGHDGSIRTGALDDLKDPEGTTRRTCVVVLGMHRSGTSAFTRVLSIAGAKLPSDLMGATRGNDAGHWESVALYEYHDRMLAELGSAWDDWRPLDFAKLSVARRTEIKIEIADVVASKFGDAPLIVVKDPRVCRFAPLFADALESAGYDCRFVVPIRSPLEVIDSLERRDHKSRAHSALLWLRHVLDAEGATRDRARAVLTYDGLLSDWMSSFGLMTERLGIAWPYPASDIAPQVDAFLSDSHRHHATTTEQVLHDPMLRDWCADVYSALLVLERNPNSAAALDALDRVRREFAGASPVLERLLAEAEHRRATEVHALAGQIDGLNGALNQVAAARADAEAAFTELEAASAARQAELQNAISAAQNELTALNDQLAWTRDALESARNANDGLTVHSDTLKRSLADLQTRYGDLLNRSAEVQTYANQLQEQLEASRMSAAEAAVRLEAHGAEVRAALAAGAQREERALAEARAKAEVIARLEDAAAAAEVERVCQAAAAQADRARIDAALADAQNEARIEREARQNWAASALQEMQSLRQTIAQKEEHLHAMGSSTSWRLTRPLRGLKRALTEREFRRRLPYRVARGMARRLGLPVTLRAKAKALATKLGLIYTGAPVRIAPLTPVAPVSAAAQTVDTPVVAASAAAIAPRADGALYRILWIVNDSDLQTQKYRVFNYADELSRRNVSSVVMREAEVMGVDPAGYDVVVFNRIAVNEHTCALAQRCKSLGIPTRYDIDDLVFDADRLDLLRFTRTLEPDGYQLFRNGVVARRDLMLMCDAVTTSTAELAREVRKLGRPAFVLPNTIGRADLEEFGNYRPLRQMSGGDRVRIGYFSGTKTHEHDFACCAEALAIVLRNNKNAELVVVGELSLPDTFAGLEDRIVTRPLMSHGDMLRELATIDINLAPLELGNTFTACKSELKIFEAALLSIPSVASPTPTFAAIVEHGETGMLAASTGEWVEAIERLVTDAQLRRAVGKAAKDRIVKRFSIETAVEEALIVDRAMISRVMPPLPDAINSLPIASKEREPLITVVAILYNKRNEVRYFLEALRRQDFPGPFEILLVDDHSPDDSVAVVEEFYRQHRAGRVGLPDMSIRILRNEKNLGNCECRNRAMSEAKSDIVVIVDADCMLNQSFLLEHYRAHAHGDCDAAIGPMNIETNDASQYSILGAHEADSTLRASQALLQDDVNKDSFVNCVTRNFSVSKKFVSARLNAPLFDNQFAYSSDPQSGFGWEDVEMGCRLYKAGARIRFLPNTFSIHCSHPSTTSEKTKPLRSLRNFRRLYEKHSDLILLARQWSVRTHDAIVGWVAANGLSLKDSDDESFLAGVFDRYSRSPISVAKKRQLRVLSHRWHCPHQYELYRGGHDVTLVTGAGTAMCDGWEFDKRPMPANARFVQADKIDPRDYDVAIVHFDENVLHPERCNGKVPADWGRTLDWLLREAPLPTIGVCHGTPQFAGQYNASYDRPDLGQVNEASRRELVEYLKNVMVVCNSHQARHEWGFAKSTTIWHGFAPNEYPQTPQGGGVLTMLGAALENRPHYNGMFVVQQVREILSGNVEVSKLFVPDPPTSYQKNSTAWAEAKFRNYARAVGSYSIYLNPTLRSPMPRSRGEAMMLGLASVSMRNHDVDLFIQNGVNGFFADSADELAEQILFLARNPSALAKMSATSRRTALDLFNQDRYLSAWSRLLAEIAG